MRIVALPVDARPVVRGQVVALAAAGGVELVVPGVSQLGYFRTPADRDALVAWLRQEAAQADGLVISLDMLVYGGLVPSRFIADSEDVLRERLQLLRELRERHPQLPIYAFAATMRISNNNINEEEKEYWSTFGEAIWQWSWHTDRAQQQGGAEAQRAAAVAEAAVPAAIRDDYLATRARNLAVTMTALDLVEAGVIDRLILPQDDTAEWGFNIAERRALEAERVRRGLAERVHIYPGADEVIHTLCAHLVSRLRNAARSGESAQSAASPKLSTLSKLSVALQFADPVGIHHLRARYEDRPIMDSIAAQFAAAGAQLMAEDDASTPDIVVGVWTRGAVQGDWAMRIPLPDTRSEEEVLRDAQPWFAKLFRDSLAGIPIAVVDLAYANGGDPVLMTGLRHHGLLSRLAGYAAWNTASNSLGNLAAQLVLARSDYASARNRALLALRYLEDYLYQAVWRQRVRDQLQAQTGSPGEFDESSTSVEARQQCVAALFVPAANAWLREQDIAQEVVAVSLPWQRTFEIDVQLATLVKNRGESS